MAEQEETEELLRLRERQRQRQRQPHGAPHPRSAVEGDASNSAGLVSGFQRRTWVLFSVIGGLIYGYNVSLGASLQYIRDDLALAPAQEEALSAMATLSDATSMLVGGHLADRFGRKATAMAACTCSIVGALASSVGSASFTWLALWRLFSGVGNGLSILLLPMYISECVDATSRGAFLTLFQLGVNAGVAVPYIFMLVVSESWRACLAFGSLPALYVLYSFHFYFPESIKWLRWKENPGAESSDLEDGASDASGRDAPWSPSAKHAAQSYQRTLGEDSTAPSPTASSASSSSPPLHSRPHLELFIGVLLAYANNCVDASLFYGPEILAKTSGAYSRRDANVFGLLCALVAVASVLFAARFVIARFSRRRVYLLCLAVVCGCFLVSGGLFARFSTDDFAHNRVASVSIIVTFAVLNIFAAVGPSILFVVILSELFQDSSYRARYMSYCTFSMSLFSLLVNGSMLSLFEALGTAETFLAYGASYVLCLLFFWAYLPETKQRQIM